MGFRYFATDLARNFAVRGWVRNLATGDVEINVEGDKEAVSGFLKELKSGPKYGKITNFQIEWKPYEGKLDSFQVRF